MLGTYIPVFCLTPAPPRSSLTAPFLKGAGFKPTTCWETAQSLPGQPAAHCQLRQHPPDSNGSRCAVAWPVQSLTATAALHQLIFYGKAPSACLISLHYISHLRSLQPNCCNLWKHLNLGSQATRHLSLHLLVRT